MRTPYTRLTFHIIYILLELKGLFDNLLFWNYTMTMKRSLSDSDSDDCFDDCKDG